MRLVATLSLFAVLSAPIFGAEPRRDEEIARFVSAAEEISGMGPGAGTAANDSRIEDIVRRHGFSERRWRSVSHRVLTAHHVARMIDLRADQVERKGRGAAPTIPARLDRPDLAAFSSAARSDLVALEAETAADRVAVQPYFPRLDSIVAPR